MAFKVLLIFFVNIAKLLLHQSAAGIIDKFQLKAL